MKTIQFTPSLCSEQKSDSGEVMPPKFKGVIVLKVPNFYERNKLKIKLMQAFAKDGETSVEAMQTNAKKVNVPELLERMAELIQDSEQFYDKVELENLSSGVVHKSFSDLSYDPEADAILREVAQELAGGLKLSKNS